MPFVLPPIASLEKEFALTEVPNYKYVTEENPVTGVFRQALEGESTKRDAFMVVPVESKFHPNGSFAGEIRKPQPIAERRAYEVWLTLSNIDLILRDNKPLCTFETKDGVSKVKESFGHFNVRWGQVDKPLASAIHSECLEANPDWGFSWLSDEDTEGEAQPENGTLVLGTEIG